MQKNVRNMHYHVQDTVLYGQSGVCRIADIAEKDVGGGLRAYYVLQPVFEESATIFVPVGNEALTAKMRRVMSGNHRPHRRHAGGGFHLDRRRQRPPGTV